MKRKKETLNFKDIYPYYKDEYEIKNRVLYCKDQIMKYVKYALNKGTPSEKLKVNEILPTMVQNGLKDVKITNER